MSAQSSAMSSNTASKDASSIGNGISATGGPTSSGSQQTEWVRRTNGVSSSNTPVNNSTINQSGPRRPSLSTTLTHHPREYPSSASLAGNASGTVTPSSAAYQPPHSTARDALNPFKYSKEYMLNKFEGLELNGTLADVNKVNKLLLGESEKEGLFGGASKERNGNGAEACWDSSGQQRPVSFEAMTSEEKDLFQSVNSVQKPHQTPNTPSGPNSTSVPSGQIAQPRNSTSSTNLNSNFHKPNVSVSSTGTAAPPGTASPTARNRPRRDTGDTNPLARRRTDRDDPGNPFDRFSGRPSLNQASDDARDTEDSGPGRGVFKRQASGGPWGVSSPITPGGSAFGAFSNGAFGGVGSSNFVLTSGVPATKPEGDRKFGSLGKSTGRSLVGDRVEEETEETDNAPTGDANDTGTRSSLQELARESEAEPEFRRGEYGRRSDSTDTDPYNPRKSLQPGDLEVDNPLDDGLRNPHSQLGQDSYFNEPSVGPIGRNMMSSPTRNLGGAFNAFGSSVASPSSSRQGQHTPLSGFHHIQTQMGGPASGSQEPENPSPSSTNPYQSPIPETEEGAGEEGGSLRNFRPPGGSDRSQTSSAGIIGAGLPGFGGLGGGFNNPLGASGLWSNPPPSGALTGTPQHTGPTGFFGPSGDSSGVGTPSGTSSGAFGTTRASRLGALFPVEQQQQLIQEQQRQQNRNMYDEDSAFDPTEAFRGLSMADRPKTENLISTDSMFGGPPRGDNAYFDGAEGQAAGQQIQPKASFPALSHSNSVSSLQQFGSTATPGAAPGSSTQPGSQRNSGGHIMIMPDKISWVYKDPTGKIQGPFSGLEMHDWYKAGFFQPDLLIRRQEETEFELLGHFIRRVGNSREPFLIPMQGPAFPPGAGWTAPSPWGQNTIDAANGIVQPPFPGAFPTFGTTLTAEQQNALERRKQEEQYLMARQREYLVQQQVIAKQVAAAQHMSRMSQESLQHHPSQASLHSQPSLTNIQSPSTFPPQSGPFGELRHTTSNPSIDGFSTGPREEFAGFPQGFNTPAPPPPPQQTSREQAQVLERQRAQMARQYQGQHQMLERQQQQRAQIFQQAMGQPARDQQQHGNQGPVQGPQAGGPGAMPPYQVAAGDDAIDITQDVGFDNDARSDMTGTALADEYELFQKQHQMQIQQHDEDLLNQHYDQGQSLSYFPGDIDFTTIPPHNVPMNNETNETTTTSITAISAGPGPQIEPGTYIDDANANEASAEDESLITSHDDEQITTVDVQTQSPLLTTSPPEPPKNPWGSIPQSGMPLPFPAPKSIASPRPSTAQSMTKSPAVSTAELQTVPIAPWAKDLESAPHQKGPSLKEIQENQAKQVAKAEAAAQEARRQEQAQQAALAAASTPTPPTSGLPSTSTWAAPTPSPATNTIAWAKPLAKASTTPVKQKTLAQIQKEEEARKQKAVAHPPSSTTPAPATTPSATPARRSEWASKAAAAPTNPNAPAATTTGGAWTTVGAGGKKLGGAATISSPTLSQARIVSNAPTPKIVKKPATVQLAALPPQKTANDEFMKWCKINLKGLNSGVNVDEFVTMILSFPPEIDLISDSVYQQSTTIDGRRFAEEFIRRRKLAQQGVVVDHGHHSDENKTAGGWSEVAKKGRETSTGASSSTAPPENALGSGSFKVVQGKKKRR